MTTITLKYDPSNKVAKKTIDYILSLGVFKVETDKSPYDKEFVKQILDTRKSKGKVIKTEDLWK